MGTGNVSDDENIALAAENFAHAPRCQRPALIIIRGGNTKKVAGIKARINDGAGNLQRGKFFDGRDKFPAIHRREHDPVHMARDGVVDNLDLAGAVGFTIRTIPINFVTEILAGFFRPGEDGLPENQIG